MTSRKLGWGGGSIFLWRKYIRLGYSENVSFFMQFLFLVPYKIPRSTLCRTVPCTPSLGVWCTRLNKTDILAHTLKVWGGSWGWEMRCSHHTYFKLRKNEVLKPFSSLVSKTFLGQPRWTMKLVLFLTHENKE